MINESTIQISRIRVVFNMLNRDLIQVHHSMTSKAEGLKAPKFSKNFLLAMLQVRKENPKLALPVAKKVDIWSYYQFLKISAFVHSDMLIVVLILPLLDTYVECDLFKAHSLLLLGPELKKVFTYEINHPYIVI